MKDFEKFGIEDEEEASREIKLYQGFSYFRSEWRNWDLFGIFKTIVTAY